MLQHPCVLLIKEERRKAMFVTILKDMINTVFPILKELPKQWIHGDLNDQNILLSTSDPRDKVIGIIDFGDASYSYRVIDLAISPMYIMATSTKEKCLELAKQLYKGYTSRIEVKEKEKQVLFLLVITRFIQSIFIAEYTYEHVDPRNEYVMVTARVAPHIFEYLVSIGEEDVLKYICD